MTFMAVGIIAIDSVTVITVAIIFVVGTMLIDVADI